MIYTVSWPNDINFMLICNGMQHHIKVSSFNQEKKKTTKTHGPFERKRKQNRFMHNKYLRALQLTNPVKTWNRAGHQRKLSLFLQKRSGVSSKRLIPMVTGESWFLLQMLCAFQYAWNLLTLLLLCPTEIIIWTEFMKSFLFDPWGCNIC